MGRFISADTIVQAPYDPQSLNRYSYCRNNPINYTDPTGHKWSWNKFWHSAVGAVLGVALAIVLGPAGLGMSMAMAGMWGGMAGGALTGGLEGGWKGALIGGALGGVLGGIGGWGIANYGAGFGVGMLAAGAAYSGATNSWDSFAGGFVGGLCGAAVGGGIVGAYSEQFNNSREGYGFRANRDVSLDKAFARIQEALTTNLADDPPVLIFRRGIEDGLHGEPQGIRIHPIMKDWEGNYHELANIKGRIKILEGNLSNMSAPTQKYMAGNPVADQVFMVYGSKFFQAINSYKARYEGQLYWPWNPSGRTTDEYNCIGFAEYVISRSKHE